MTSPPFRISSTSARISFNHFYTGWQPAGVLELSANGGPFTDVEAIGGIFVTGRYNQVLSVLSPSSLAGRNVWFGWGPLNTVVRLPATFAGKTVQVRLRAATTDECSFCTGTPFDSWRVDTFVCDDGIACNAPLVLSGPRRVAGQLEFGWNAFPGRYYQMQYKTNLSQTDWLDLAGLIFAADSDMTWSTSVGVDRQRFYRLLINP